MSFSFALLFTGAALFAIAVRLWAFSLMESHGWQDCLWFSGLLTRVGAVFCLGAALQLLTSCSLVLQKTGPDGSVNVVVGVLGKTGATDLSGPAGQVGSFVADSNAAVNALATAYGVGVTVKGATKAEIAKSSHATKQAISTNKTTASIKRIEAGAATKQAAINAATP